FFQAEDGIRDFHVTGVQTCALPILPVALTSFGYHHSVASMRAYYGEEKKAQKAILGGTSIALAFYLTWLVSIFGNLPRADFGPRSEERRVGKEGRWGGVERGVRRDK